MQVVVGKAKQEAQVRQGFLVRLVQQVARLVVEGAQGVLEDREVLEGMDWLENPLVSSVWEERFNLKTKQASHLAREACKLMAPSLKALSR
tara:strand:+ start:140 stop:412 length:273 start_codon:yes stop_codon:yes gene_type:complete